MDIKTLVPTLYGDWLPRFGELWNKQVQQLRQEFSQSVENVLMPGKDLTDIPTVFVKKDRLVDIASFIKGHEDFNYQFLSDITATDETPRKPRFDLVYHFFSHTSFSRIRIKVKIEEEETAPTLIKVWPGANWAEREIFDMYGVQFKDHPDLRRILMDVRWQGHPLRKDYPLKGYQIFSTPEPIDEDLLRD